MERQYFQNHAHTLARHPFKTGAHMMVRVLASHSTRTKPCHVAARLKPRTNRHSGSGS